MIRNSRGMSLVELVIAMFVLLVVSLALMQTALVSIDSNTKNVLRDEAVRIAGMKMDGLRGVDFDDLDAQDGTSQSIQVRVRNIDAFPFSVFNAVSTVGNVDNRRIDVRVEWTWKGTLYNTTTLSSIRHRGE